MQRLILARALACAAVITASASLGAASQSDPSDAVFDITKLPASLAGDNSVANTTINAFSLPSPALPVRERLDFSFGNSFFRNPWVSAPASTAARDGLGPLFNTNACQNCHLKDGRGHLPANAEDNAVSMLVRLSVGPSAHPWQGSQPHPIYGGQLQDFATPGVMPEAQLAIHYDYHTVELNGGEQIELRKPRAELKSPAYGAVGDQLKTSIRIAPPVIGLGLLEAIPEAAIMAQSDPNDSNHDGISGRINQVWNQTKQATQLGRFGWKAEQPTLRQQNAAAFSGDMGLSTPIFASDDCSDAQTQCKLAANGGNPEVSEKILDRVTFYTANLAVPQRRDIDNPAVLAGGKHFMALGCGDCHRPMWQTGPNPDMPWLANQTIYPFTDLLVHDMGEGLSDQRPVYTIQGNEWRTPPLWGLGLTSAVNEEFGFLHDGRARTITEAILWHGGEAKASQQAFIALTPAIRNELLDFLNSL
jgi:CxxC motif-containing protein (DUF1111 family)